MTKMNLGCGKDIREGWINVDEVPANGVDLVVDLDGHKASYELAPENTVSEFHVSHLIEHLHSPLHLLEVMWWAAKPGAKATFRCPYGSSDDADEDPTHVRRMYVGSWGYFSQPYYYRADYGYRGDWKVENVTLIVMPEFAGMADEAVLEVVRAERNVVCEMVAVMTAVKPRREQKQNLMTPTPITIVPRS